jgi:hypothetical protein
MSSKKRWYDGAMGQLIILQGGRIPNLGIRDLLRSGLIESPKKE